MVRNKHVFGRPTPAHLFFPRLSPRRRRPSHRRKSRLARFHERASRITHLRSEGLPANHRQRKGQIQASPRIPPRSFPRPRGGAIRARRKRPRGAPLLRHRAPRPRDGRSRTRFGRPALLPIPGQRPPPLHRRLTLDCGGLVYPELRGPPLLTKRHRGLSLSSSRPPSRRRRFLSFPANVFACRAITMIKVHTPPRPP